MSENDAQKPDMQAENADNRRNNGQFAKGASGNPRGRPKGVRYLSEAFRFFLAARNELNPAATNADEIAGIVGAAALSGDLKACELLLTRTEGKPREWPKYRRELGEDDDRLKTEQEIYYRMEDDGLDYSAVVELIEEESRAEIEEALRDQKARRRDQKAQEKRLAEQIAASIAKAEAKQAEASLLADVAGTRHMQNPTYHPLKPEAAQAASWMDKYLVKAAEVQHLAPVVEAPQRPLTADEEIALYKAQRQNGG